MEVLDTVYCSYHGNACGPAVIFPPRMCCYSGYTGTVYLKQTHTHTHDNWQWLHWYCLPGTNTHTHTHMITDSGYTGTVYLEQTHTHTHT